MLNFRVRDLDAMLEQLRTKGADQRVRKIAAEARPLFEGMASLRNKFFTFDERTTERGTSTCGSRTMRLGSSSQSSSWSE